MSTAFQIDPINSYGESTMSSTSVWRHSAVSSEADTVARDTWEVTDTLTRSRALFGNKLDVINDLWSTAYECREEDWDGEDADPIHTWAVLTAERFIHVLPPDIPMPEVVPEPDGALGLEWWISRHQILSVSFGVDLRLAYAWLDGTDKGHGVARFDGETIPQRILDGIGALTRS